jgi:hypothetical protein
LKRIEQLANFAVTGNTHGESIMIDRHGCMNQIATALGHDKEGEKQPEKAVSGELHHGRCARYGRQAACRLPSEGGAGL